MFEAGLISEKELKALGEELKPLLLGQDWRQKSAAAGELEVPVKAAPPEKGQKPTAVPTKPIENESGVANPSKMSMTADPKPSMSLGYRWQASPLLRRR
jgi:hypothetical protein